MPLTPGTRLGPYEILSALGAGGMGEVYRARDTKLGRDVALKVLPELLASDPERLARLHREAQVLASLNHPNIAAIYGFEDSNATHALVMELVEGPTLDDRIAKGPIPIAEALLIAKQIAEALEAAHEQGIVHRDLKPANIKLREDGRVKVLDFGLAKAVEAIQDIGNSTDLPTMLVQGGTQAGVILGTVAYMSPEQARGKALDKRADIWAFGCVLFEMLAGGSVFPGDTPTDVIAAVVQKEPDWKQLPAETPSAVQSLLRRCLTKAHGQRLRDIGDARIELSDAIAHPSGSVLTGLSGARVIRTWPQYLAWVMASAGVSIVLFLTFRPAPVMTRDAFRLSILPPERTAFTGQVMFTVGVPQFELSPDGRAIVFAAATHGNLPTLWLRPLDSTAAHTLPGTDGAESPFWSPDNRWIGFFADGKLKKTPAVGGPVQEIAPVLDPRPASWGVDDTIVFSRGVTGILRVSAAGGAITPVFELDASRQEGQHRFPQFLPDGMHFLFAVRSNVAANSGIYVGSLDGKVKKQIISGVATRGFQPVARYSSGFVFFMDGDSLMRQPFDPSRLELTGSAVLVEGGVGRSSGGGGAYSLSDAGTLAYSSTLSAPSQLTWFDRAGNPSSSIGTVGDHTDFRLSPDETELAASLASSKTGFPDIWLTDVRRGIASPFTFGPFNASAVWSPDSARILFRTTRAAGLTEFYLKSAGGGGKGNETLVLPRAMVNAVGGLVDGSVINPSDWSPDGRYVVFSSNGSSDSDLWILPFTGDRKPVVLLKAHGDQWHGNFSPDGHLLAYTSNESGRFEIHVQTFPISEQQWPISTDGGYEPRWRADGRELYYLSDDQKLMYVSVSPGPTPTFSTPAFLFQTSIAGLDSPQRTHYVPSRDGRRFLVSVPMGDATIRSITLVLNVPADFRK